MQTPADNITELLQNAKRVREVHVSRGAEAIADIATSQEPLILKGFIKDWPVVEAAQSRDTLLSYLQDYEKGAIVDVSAGTIEVQGRLFYNKDYTGMNTERGNATMGKLLQQVHQYGDKNPTPLIYMASTDVDHCLPGFRVENDLDFGDVAPIISVWIGTRTRIAAHNDLPLNIACVAAGKRRFTLFAPDQTPNLYPGPFELTPAGRPISMVDFANPDMAAFPNFQKAIDAAHVAELEAGDAVFIPSMWWHHVEALGDFNMLVNYWWRTVPNYLGTPQDVLNHAMLTLRDMPQTEKEIWRDIFDYYVFGEDAGNADHIPEKIRGILSPINEDSARHVRAFLLNRLNR